MTRDKELHAFQNVSNVQVSEHTGFESQQQRSKRREPVILKY